MRDKKFLLMIVYNSIQHDARVIRGAEVMNSLNKNVTVLSCNSDVMYKNEKFKSIVFTSKYRGLLLLISFWTYVIYYCIINRKKISLLYMHDYYMVFIGNVISKLIQVNWVYDAHELIIEHLSDINNIRRKIFVCFEKLFIGSASLVITANEERKRIIEKIYKLNNIISVSNVSPRVIQDIQETNRDDYIVYQGYMSEKRRVSDLLNILKYLPKNIKLKLLGTGPDLPLYKEIVSDLSLDERVLFFGMIPYSELLKESKNCKVGFVSYSMEGLNNYYCSPNKIYEYAQIGLPMLVTQQPFLKQIILKYNIGEVLDSSISYEDQAKLIQKIINNFEEYQQGMESFLLDYTYENEMNKLKESMLLLYDQIDNKA